jgi:hypothetical protein
MMLFIFYYMNYCSRNLSTYSIQYFEDQIYFSNAKIGEISIL